MLEVFIRKLLPSNASKESIGSYVLEAEKQILEKNKNYYLGLHELLDSNDPDVKVLKNIVKEGLRDLADVQLDMLNEYEKSAKLTPSVYL